MPWLMANPSSARASHQRPRPSPLSKRQNLPIPSPIRHITSLYGCRAMIRCAGGAIGAVTAMVERPIRPSKAVEVDSGRFWPLLQL